MDTHPQRMTSASPRHWSPDALHAADAEGRMLQTACLRHPPFGASRDYFAATTCSVITAVTSSRRRIVASCSPTDLIGDVM